MHVRTLLILTLLCSSFGWIACNDKDDSSAQEVTIAWEAILGDQTFQSGTCVDGIGSEGVAVNVSDLRFYVSDVEAQNSEGTWVQLSLSERSWQGDGVTLIDLADTETESGTAGMNNYIEGTLEEGEYNALRFTLGVPFDLNHSDFNAAHAPLNVGGMAWSWLAGRKFLRLDATPCGAGSEELDIKGISLHIGSTQCHGEIPNIEGCDHGNRSRIQLDWSPGENIVLDLDALFADSDIYHPTEETPSLCMADPSVDPDCAPIFAALGISWDDRTAEQRIFTSTDHEIHAHASGEADAGGDDGHDEHHDHH